MAPASQYKAIMKTINLDHLAHVTGGSAFSGSSGNVQLKVEQSLIRSPHNLSGAPYPTLPPHLSRISS
jgi:hypothetical protein